MSAAISHDPAPTDGLEVYQVGGSVRDELLGLPVSDRDYVVVGSTPDEMIRRGFVSVGKDFPVFLHPQTHEEYALARTERKTAPGYHGFVFDANPDVTLEEDLSRRDLTINAMAVDHSGQLIDPYNGRLDLAQGTLRHVSEAFVEDPVRVLRLARFATRFEDFVVAPTTLSLCQAMVVAGELDALVPERVWTELALALMYHKPSRFFTVLSDAHALAVVWPQLSAAMDHEAFWQAMQAMDASAHQHASLESRFALLCRAMSLEDVKASCAQLKAPNRCRQWAVWANVHLAQLMDLTDQTPEQILNFVQSFDGLRQPDRLDVVAMMAKAYGRSSNKSNAMDAALGFLEEVMEALASLDPTPWVAQGLAGPDMGAVIEAERQALIAKVQKRSA